MRVIGLNAAGGQFLPPQSEGQKSVFLPVPGLCSGSTSGRPVFGSTLLNTFCFTNGSPSTKCETVGLVGLSLTSISASPLASASRRVHDSNVRRSPVLELIRFQKFAV
jgi:hypothetical protein